MPSSDVPIGTVLDFYWINNVNEVPTGFQLCDGSGIRSGPLRGRPTPDLRNRFVRGAPRVQQCMRSGGSDSHKHNISVPNHKHLALQFVRADAVTEQWKSGDGQLLTSWQNGIPDMGGAGGHCPLSRKDGDENTNVYTSVNIVDGESTESDSGSNVPRYVYLVKIIRIE